MTRQLPNIARPSWLGGLHLGIGRVHLKNLRLEEEHYPQEALVVAQIALVGHHWRVRFNTKLQELLILLGKTVLLSQ